MATINVGGNSAIAPGAISTVGVGGQAMSSGLGPVTPHTPYDIQVTAELLFELRGKTASWAPKKVIGFFKKHSTKMLSLFNRFKIISLGPVLAKEDRKRNKELCLSCEGYLLCSSGVIEFVYSRDSVMRCISCGMKNIYLDDGVHCLGHGMCSWSTTDYSRCPSCGHTIDRDANIVSSGLVRSVPNDKLDAFDMARFDRTFTEPIILSLYSQAKSEYPMQTFDITPQVMGSLGVPPSFLGIGKGVSVSSSRPSNIPVVNYSLGAFAGDGFEPTIKYLEPLEDTYPITHIDADKRVLVKEWDHDASTGERNSPRYQSIGDVEQARFPDVQGVCRRVGAKRDNGLSLESWRRETNGGGYGYVGVNAHDFDSHESRRRKLRDKP